MMCISSYPHSTPLRAHHPLHSRLPISSLIPIFIKTIWFIVEVVPWWRFAHISQSSSKTSPSICRTCISFIFTTQNTPRGMSLSSPAILHPKLSRKDSFSVVPSFSSVILHTAWKMRLSSPTSFDPKFSRKYRFSEDVSGWFIGL